MTNYEKIVLALLCQITALLFSLQLKHVGLYDYWFLKYAYGSLWILYYGIAVYYCYLFCTGESGEMSEAHKVTWYEDTELRVTTDGRYFYHDEFPGVIFKSFEAVVNLLKKIETFEKEQKEEGIV